MIKLLPLLIIAFLGYLTYSHFKKLKPEQKRPFVIKIMVYVVVALLIAAVLTGRIHWLGAVAAAALGLLKVGASTAFRFLPFLQTLGRSRVFGDPVFKTPFLEMKLILANNRLEGRVLQGEMADRPLASLTEDELNSLEATLKASDRRGYYLLRVYRQGAASASQQEQASRDQELTQPNVEEARLMLGLDKGFNKNDVDKAYKRLIQRVHPDRGGNDYLASRINLARDILLDSFNGKK